MKKSTIISILVFAITLLFSTQIEAQKFRTLDKSPMDAAYFPGRSTDKLVKVYYSRPQLKGRALSALAPNGKVWRTGANESTEITFYQDVTFGDKAVKAGTYTLFTVPGNNEWTVILNSDLNTWGAYSYNNANDVAKIKAKATNGNDVLEAFSITFDSDSNMHLGWGDVRIEVPISK